MSFPVVVVDPNSVLRDEQLGSKKKYWFERDGARWLFKEGREGTGEDWAEKLVAEIAKLAKIPAATVELAELNGRRGSISRSFIEAGDALIHGNEILAGMIVGYDRTKRLRQSDHTLENLILAVQRLFGPNADQALITLASYLVLDALVCNTDRHHENWGVIIRADRASIPIRVHLRPAPSFDHASSLGRELREERYKAYVANDRIDSYVQNGRGGIYLRSSDAHGANPLHLVQVGARRFPEYFRCGLDLLCNVSAEELQSLAYEVPDELMTEAARTFVSKLLARTHATLVGLLQ